MTNEFLNKNSKLVTHIIVVSGENITTGKEAFKLFYPGLRHSMDDIVLGFLKKNILYGRYFIKNSQIIDLTNKKYRDVRD